MSGTTSCIACGSTLQIHSHINAVCENPNCSGGGHFCYCGHCRHHSYSNPLSHCVTPSCSTYNKKRDKCVDCHLTSMISIDGTSLCLNRGCSSHATSITLCNSCGNKSLIEMPAFTLCLKSDCITVLKPRLKSQDALSPTNDDLALSLFMPAPFPSDKAEGTLNFGSAPVVHPSSATQVESGHQMDMRSVTEGIDEADDKTVAPCEVQQVEIAAIPQGDATHVVDLQEASRVDMSPEHLGAVVEAGTETEADENASDPWGFGAGVDDSRTTRLSRKLSEVPEQELSLEDPLPKGKALTPTPERVSAPQPIPDLAPVVPEQQPIAEPVAPAAPSLMAAFNMNAAPEAPVEELETPAPSQEQTVDLAPHVEDASESTDAPSSRPEGVESEIELAYEFLLQSLIETEDGSMSPVILVFGLAGAGKSTYLTMLGEMLAKGQSQYHFPYDDITTRSIQVDTLIDRYWGESASEADREILRRRVRDLTFDYSSRNYEDYLMNGTWVPPTVRESGDEDNAHSHFLATEVLREGVTIGNIITMETSGEDFQELLGNIAQLRSEKQLDSALHRVLYRLLNRATGVLILVDPESVDSDQQYHHIFRVFKENIEVRAAQALESKVHALKRGDEERRAKEDGDIGIDDALARASTQEDEDARHQEARQQLAEDLRILDVALTHAPASHAGVADVVAQHKRLIDELEAILQSVRPEFQEKADALFTEHGRTVQNFMQYYKSLLTTYRDQTVFTVAVGARMKIRHTSRQERKDLIQRVCANDGISEPIHEAFLEQTAKNHISDRMRFLRYVSLVVTKSDRHPSVYPPEDYPKFKLPTCHVHTRTLQSHLQLLDGFFNCYNTTAIGYSIQRGDRYAPGPGNSFTPVNIIEPLFDMLLHEERMAGDET